MSVNNFYFAKKIGNKWYGWDETAEECMNDNGTRELYTDSADAIADSLNALEEKLDSKGLGYSEYGLTTSPYLPKDGTPIIVIEA